MGAYILELDNYTNLFGNDTQHLFDACNKVMKNWLYPYENCYSAVKEFRKTSLSGSSCLGKAYKAFLAEHPDEAKKVEVSRKEWEKEHDKQFRIIYGIAKRHGIYMHWHGNDTGASCGDQWTIYKNHCRIGQLYCW